MIELRPFQAELQEDLRAALRRPGENGEPQRRVIAQLPTGGGKTVTAASMIQNSERMGFRSMFVVHGRQLVFQASRTLSRYGIEHGVVMSGAAAKRAHAPIQVASVDTLASYLRRGNTHHLPPADLVIVDEAHESTSPSWQRVLGQYERSVVVGLTATPAKGDGSGLGPHYEEIVMGPTVQWLTDSGYLVPADYYSVDVPDLSSVSVQNGDYVKAQLDEFMGGKTLVGDVVKTWRKHAAGRPTLVFAAGVRHSKYICEAFNEAGISAFHIDADTPQADRDAAFAAIADGSLQVLTNNRVLNRGFDCPAIEVCIDAAPTLSFVAHIQKLGRVLRTAEGKGKCLILDHTGNLLRHGPVTREYDWDLTPTEEANADRARERIEALSREVVCGSCGFVFTESSRCPQCGWQIPQGEKTPQDVERIVGELRKLTPEYWAELAAERAATLSGDDKRRWWAMLLFEARRRGYNPGWAAHVYKSRTGVWPNGAIKRNVSPIPPDAEVIRFIGTRMRKQKGIQAG